MTQCRVCCTPTVRSIAAMKWNTGSSTTHATVIVNPIRISGPPAQYPLLCRSFFLMAASSAMGAIEWHIYHSNCLTQLIEIEEHVAIDVACRKAHEHCHDKEHHHFAL